jgi:hypothetical protein
MGKKIGAGVACGLIGGVALDALMRILPVRASDGSNISMITFIADAIHASNPWAGWLMFLAYGMVIGGLFGWLLHNRTLDAGPGALWGGVYGLCWWVVAGVVLVPALLGSLPLSSFARESLQRVAVPLLVGHIVYGVILGAAFSYITRTLIGSQGRNVVGEASHRAASR